MTDERDLPEGVIDADPPGGWADGATADEETDERSAAAEDSPGLSESGLPPDGHDRPDASTDPAQAPEGTIESDEPSQGVDADLAPRDAGEEP